MKTKTEKAIKEQQIVNKNLLIKEKAREDLENGKLAKSLIDLENRLMKMPELEQENEMIHKAMNNINTFQCCEGELYLRGSDEYGRDFQVVFDAYDFLNWIDTEDIEYIKEQVIKHIKTK